MFVADDIISSGEACWTLPTRWKKQGAKRILPNATYAIFTNGLDSFDKAYADGMIAGVFGSNLTYRTPELLSPPLVPRGGRIQVYRLFHRRTEPRPFRQRHHRSPRKDQGSARTHRTGPLEHFSFVFYRKARCFLQRALVFRRFSALDQRSVVKSGLGDTIRTKIKTARQSRRAGRNRMDARYTGEQIAAAPPAQKRLTQKQLADALGVTDKAVSKWERGLNYPDIVLFQPSPSCLGFRFCLAARTGFPPSRPWRRRRRFRTGKAGRQARHEMARGIPPGGRPDAVRCAGLCFPRAGSARHLRLAAGVYHGNAAFHRLALRATLFLRFGR